MQKLYLSRYLKERKTLGDITIKVNLYGQVVAIASEYPCFIKDHMDDDKVIAFFYAKQIEIKEKDDIIKKSQNNKFLIDDIILIYMYKKSIGCNALECQLRLCNIETISGTKVYIANFDNYFFQLAQTSMTTKQLLITQDEIKGKLNKYTNQITSGFLIDTDLSNYIKPSNKLETVVESKELLSEFPRLGSTKSDMKHSIENTQKEVLSVYETVTFGLSEKQKKQIDMINTLVDKSTEKRKETVDKLLTMSKSKEYTNKYITTLCNAIERYYYPMSTQGQGICGKELLRKYMQALDIPKHYDIMGTPIIDYVLQNFSTIREGLCNNDSVAEELYFITSEDLTLYNKLFSNPELFYAGMISILTGTSIDTMRNLYFRCKDYDLSLSVILNTNPYIFSFIADDIITAKRIEILAQFYSLEINPLLDDSRYLTYLAQSTLLDSSSTMIELSEFYDVKLGVTFTENQYNRLITTGSVLTANQLANANRYLVSKRNSSYDKQFIQKTSANEYLYIPNGFSKEKILIACMESGFLTRLGSTCFSVTTTLQKEIYVLTTMLQLSEHMYDYKIEDVRKIVNDYESELPFTLEQDQRNAAGLIRYGASIITGVAGSGKTTMIRMFMRLLETLEPNATVEFVAPTGRAAKRMREVLGVDAQTIHRNFKLTIGTKNLLSLKDENKVGKQRVIILFLDEGAMVPLDVFYDMLIKINCKSKNTRIYLFGDINQLPPIGKGTPFRDLLYFLPNVKFPTCKRTAAASNINAMATQFIQDKFTPLKSEKDFFLIDCNKNNIPNIIANLCLYYLNKSTDTISNELKQVLNLETLPLLKEEITESDIQVISPVSKEKYNWSSTALNKVLEPIFNSICTTENSYICRINSFSNDFKLAVGDRVMHVKANNYIKCHYKKTGVRQYSLITEENETGVFNGEIGTIIDIIKSTDIKLEIDESKIPTDCLNDKSWIDNDNYFIVVEFYDDISDENYYILYRATKFIPETNSYNLYQGLEGEDLNFIELAYATTVYKDQGSEQKIVILALSDIYTNYDVNSTFLCRELFYTAITRGECLVFIVGNIGGENQTFLKHLHDIVALNHIVTLGTKLADTERN